MRSPRLRRRPLLVVAGALAASLSLALAGCSVSQHAGQHTGSGTASSASSSSKAGGNAGAGSASDATIPSDFPSDVPLLTHDVVSSRTVGSGADEIWDVDITVTGVGDFDGIQTQLDAAGFSLEAGAAVTSDTEATGEFLGSKHDVLIDVKKNDDGSGWVADYEVAADQ